MATTRAPRRDKGSGNGSAVWTQLADGTGYYCARLKMPDGRRAKQQLRYKGALLTDRERDRNRAVELTARLAERCRETPPPPTDAPVSSRPTVKQFGELWTSGKLFARHGDVNKLGEKATADSDAKRLARNVYPYIGEMAVADVTDVDIEKCFAAAAQAAQARLGKPWRKATKFQIYQATKRLFDLAVLPGRLRPDNPVSSMLKPGKDKAKLYAFLYPDELLALLACRDIPLGRRVLYVLGCYCGLRKSSLVPLVWEWVDFQHRMLTALTNKNGVPQVFEVRPDVMTVLQRWYEHCGSPKRDSAVVRDLGGRQGRDAETLRKDLRLVGVTRALLFSDAPNVQPLRFHDTRATFVTWARRAGKGPGWISDRTGHLTQTMIDRYDRGARQLADLQYEPFPDLTDAIPEFSEAARNVVHMRRPRGA